MRIRPCIDIHDGKVKQIVGSSLRDRTDNREATAEENFSTDREARYYAKLYSEMGLTGGHIILLNSVKEETAYRRDLAQALDALSAFPGGMQAGGGITPETADLFLDAGASHVIVTSYVFREGRLNETALRQMLQTVGKKRLVLDLSCRRREDGQYYVVTDRWQKFTDLRICTETLSSLSEYCDEFLVHAADVEGKRSGIEEPLVTILGSFLEETGFPVTYAGGVHALEDLDRLCSLSSGRIDVTVGSALTLFGGDLELSALVEHIR